MKKLKTRIWKVIKEETKMQTQQEVNSIVEHGKFITVNKKLPHAVNIMFIRKVKTTIENLPPQTEDPLTHFKKIIVTPQKKFFFTEVTMATLKKTISSIKTSHSSTQDGISIHIMKLAAK